MRTVSNLFMVPSLRSKVTSLLLLLYCISLSAFSQPGQLQTYTVNCQAGSLSSIGYTSFAVSYYPYCNGIRNDSLSCVIGDQTTPGTSQTADRIIDITSSGTYAYRDTAGHWTGPLQTLRYGHAFLFANRHQARTLTIQGFPADSITYIFPMPASAVRFTAARMSANHPVNRLGLSWSAFHWSQNMRAGGDLVIDLATRRIARRDSTSGWIGTLDSVRIGDVILIQVNNSATFDWTYNGSVE